jgi:2-phospho-L-lactate guanylyltransferase
MDLRVIIPVKTFAEAKQRLAPALNPAERARLAEDMFLHVFEMASAFIGAANVLVISRLTDVLAIADARGAVTIAEREPYDLNSALLQAASVAQRRGASRVLALASDLPLLQKSDLAEMAQHACAIAPDRHNRGTNALLWPAMLPFAFGNDSFARHLTIADQAGISMQVVRRPGLARDVDVPEDLIDAIPRPRFSGGEA